MENAEIVASTEDVSTSTQEKIVLVASLALIVGGVGTIVYRKLKERKAAAYEKQFETDLIEETAQN